MYSTYSIQHMTLTQPRGIKHMDHIIVVYLFHDILSDTKLDTSFQVKVFFKKSMDQFIDLQAILASFVHLHCYWWLIILICEKIKQEILYNFALYFLSSNSVCSHILEVEKMEESQVQLT